MLPYTSVLGNDLRTTVIIPINKTQDLFHVQSGCYLFGMQFLNGRSGVLPGAYANGYNRGAYCVAFPPQVNGNKIDTFHSPYVQNCTSFSTSGTGMRIDGNLSEGTKSMVVDAYTQYNQGGIGIHLLNRGYAQLVSVFTIACDKGFFAESGGFCSITNSNST